MADINIGLLTVFVGMLGIFFGTLISPYINHKLNLRNTQRDLFFKKKLEYFEKIAENIDFNIRIYKNSILKLKNNQKTKILEEELEKIKEERKNFRISASPIYFDTHKISIGIREFTEVEKQIFTDFEQLKTQKTISEVVISDLEHRLEELKKAGNNIIITIKIELKKERI